MRRALLVLASLSTAIASVGCDALVLDFTSPIARDGGTGGGAGADPGGSGGGDDELPPLTVVDSFDLTRDDTPPRSCPDGGDGVQYRATELADDAITLERAPSAGCLRPGDELFVAKLRGSPSSLDGTGQNELARVTRLDGAIVHLALPLAHDYGGALTDDDVIVVGRVPNYSHVEIHEGAVLTASGWSGTGGGILALRSADRLVVDGTITMTGRGFRGGPSVDEVLGHGIAGESIAGLGAANVAPNHGGGGGGLGDQTRSACVQDGNAGGGGAHRDAGLDASVMDLCEGEGRGRGGIAYAEPGLLFLGSGGGSGGVDNVRVDNPPGGAGGAGGGVIWLLGASLGGVGRIEAEGVAGAGDVEGLECQGGSSTNCYDHSGPGGGGAGGSIRLAIPIVEDVFVSVRGGRGGNGFDFAPGNGGDGAPGVVDDGTTN